MPNAGRSLLAEFNACVAAWEWDVALLQEVPPWWPRELARSAAAEQRTATTSRNALLALRRRVADRWPDVIKSNGGGANAILSRQPITEYRRLRLRTWPERRVAQLARLRDGTCVANYHASTRPPLAHQELQRLTAVALRWANGAPLLLGGDLNLRAPRPPAADLVHVAERDVDHLFVRGLQRVTDVAQPSHRLGGGALLSDHPPLIVSLGPAPEL